MIDELHVRDVALIHDATLFPSTGLTVLTGETGAGKSALLSSVKLLMGERADASSIREGAQGLEVEGRFFQSKDDSEGSVVRRRIDAHGRGRVEINGHMASVRELSEGLGASIDLCGQHEHQRLLQLSSHTELLDAWGHEQIAGPLAAYQSCLKEARDAARELERFQEMSQNAAERLDEASFVLRRIDEVHPHEGELEELEDTLPKAEHAESLLRAAAGAREGLSGDEGISDTLSSVISLLHDATRYDRDLSQLTERLESTLIDIEDAADELRRYEDRIDFDPEVLDSMQARMAQLQGLLRTYGPRMQDVFERRTRAAELVEAAQGGDTLVRKAQEALDLAEKNVAQAADALDQARLECAPKLCKAIGEQMALLEMGSASVELAQERLERHAWTQQGPSKIELMYRPAAGMSARPLRRIASGGEISRVMLACKVVLGEADKTQTLVFDEVDAGVGGATALALAQVLAHLAQTHQVIVVTHLAQVAVYADRHYVVVKHAATETAAETASNIPETSIYELTGEERIAEIARMLSGELTQASLDHAREMLSAAQN